MRTMLAYNDPKRVKKLLENRATVKDLRDLMSRAPDEDVMVIEVPGYGCLSLSKGILRRPGYTTLIAIPKARKEGDEHES